MQAHAHFEDERNNCQVAFICKYIEKTSLKHVNIEIRYLINTLNPPLLRFVNKSVIINASQTSDINTEAAFAEIIQLPNLEASTCTPRYVGMIL